MAGLEVQFNDCSPELPGRWAGELNFKRSGLEYPCVARKLFASVAYNFNAIEFVAIRKLLVLILFHQRAPS